MISGKASLSDLQLAKEILFGASLVLMTRKLVGSLLTFFSKVEKEEEVTKRTEQPEDVIQDTKKNHKKIAKRCLWKTGVISMVAIAAVIMLTLTIVNLQYCHKEPLLPLYWALVTLIGFGSCVAMKGVIVNQIYGLRGHEFPGYNMAMGTPVLVISATAHLIKKEFDDWRRKGKSKNDEER